MDNKKSQTRGYIEAIKKDMEKSAKASNARMTGKWKKLGEQSELPTPRHLTPEDMKRLHRETEEVRKALKEESIGANTSLNPVEVEVRLKRLEERVDLLFDILKNVERVMDEYGDLKDNVVAWHVSNVLYVPPDKR